MRTAIDGVPAMSFRSRAALPAVALVLVALAGPAGAGDVSRAEFFADTKVYLGPFGDAATKLKALIAADEYQVVAVANFTDMSGAPLHVGRIYAEEISTLLVGPRSAYKVMDSAAIAEAVAASGGASIWSSTKKIRDFGKESGVQLVVTGKMEITANEARVYLKAVETDEASIVWAQTVSLPGRSAASRP